MNRFLGLGLLAVALLGVPRDSRATFIVYTAALNGAESGSTGSGSAEVDVDTVANTMRVKVTFSGLTTGTIASHIHAATALPGTGTAGVATTTPTFPNFPLGVTSGSYDMTFDMLNPASYNPAFVTANGGTAASAEAALFAALAADKAYLNIHTSQFPGGEISGFLTPVPEPSSVVLLGTGALGLVVCARRRAAR